MKLNRNLLFRVASKLTSLRRELEYWCNRRWFEQPFSPEPYSTAEQYRELATEVQKQSYPEIEQFEQESGFQISLDWLNELALQTKVVIKSSPLCYAHGRVLYAALSLYLQKSSPKRPTERITIWETGTARGFSALCMAKVLQDQQRSGLILTFDVLPHQTAMYWNCIADHERGELTRAELLNPWQELLEDHVVFHQGDIRLELPKVKSERIHFAFLDGAHTYDDVMFEFPQVEGHQLPGDVIVYDDYTPSQFPGLVQAVNEICEHHQYRRTNLQAHSSRGYLVGVKE
jgi:predicted O-methyltransferase YrrM